MGIQGAYSNLAGNNMMKINEGKTKIMIFNISRTFNFPPEQTLPESTGFLDVIE